MGLVEKGLLCASVILFHSLPSRPVTKILFLTNVLLSAQKLLTFIPMSILSFY